MGSDWRLDCTVCTIGVSCIKYSIIMDAICAKLYCNKLISTKSQDQSQSHLVRHHKIFISGRTLVESHKCYMSHWLDQNLTVAYLLDVSSFGCKKY